MLQVAQIASRIQTQGGPHERPQTALLTHGMNEKSCREFLKQKEAKRKKFRGAGKKQYRAADSDASLLREQIAMMQLQIGCACLQAIRATLQGFAEHSLPTPVTTHQLQPPCPSQRGHEAGTACCGLSCRASTCSSREDRGKEPGKQNKILGFQEIEMQLEQREVRSSIISSLYNSYIARLVPCKGIVLATTRKKTSIYIFTRFFIVMFEMMNRILYFKYYSSVQFKLALSNH